ncbi:MAG: flagellar brake protein [Methylobacter sp.]|jgi:c-di-GMP-binding flagellar brake protein YcgR|nr:flagellar brake protein [Methylobacter sp.]
MNDISSYSVKNSKQIIGYLSLLVKSKCLLSARFGADESYITTLLYVNEKNNVVILDYGAKEELNQHILKTNKVMFDAEYKGIKVSFIGSGITKTTYKGEFAFTIPIPKVLYWMERREFYRVKPPIAAPAYCQLIIGDNKPVNLKLYDISLSGFAMLNLSKDISDLLTPGTIVPEGKLKLSETEESTVAFEVCTKYVINLDKSKKIQKIGCKLIKLTRPVERNIQVYMQRVERRILQKE